MIVLQLQEDRVITKQNSMELLRDYACNRIRHNKNHLSIFVGGTGCLAGDSIINANRDGASRQYTIQYMCKQFRLGKLQEGKSLKKTWDLSRRLKRWNSNNFGKKENNEDLTNQNMEASWKK